MPRSRTAADATPAKAPKRAKRPKARGTSKRQIPPAEAIAAITRHHGLLSVAARALGCNRATLYRMIERHPTVAAAVQDARDMTTDIAESSLFQAVRWGEPWAVQFYLKTQGKARGYIERSEVDLRNVDLSKVPTDQLQAWLQDT